MYSDSELIDITVSDYENRALLYPPFSSSKTRRGHNGFLGALHCAAGIYGYKTGVSRAAMEGLFREGMKAYIKGYRAVIAGEQLDWVTSSTFTAEHVENTSGGMMTLVTEPNPEYPVLARVKFKAQAEVISYNIPNTSVVFTFEELFALYDPSSGNFSFFAEPYNFKVHIDDEVIEEYSLLGISFTDKGKGYVTKRSV